MNEGSWESGGAGWRCARASLARRRRVPEARRPSPWRASRCAACQPGVGGDDRDTSTLDHPSWGGGDGWGMVWGVGTTRTGDILSVACNARASPSPHPPHHSPMSDESPHHPISTPPSTHVGRSASQLAMLTITQPPIHTPDLWNRIRLDVRVASAAAGGAVAGSAPRAHQLGRRRRRWRSRRSAAPRPAVGPPRLSLEIVVIHAATHLPNRLPARSRSLVTDVTDSQIDRYNSRGEQARAKVVNTKQKP